MPSAESANLSGVEIYTDGACEPNPGPGGYGVVLLHPKKRAEASGGFRLTTKNRMEIFAAIKGLELLKQPCKVTLYSDSQYLVKAMMEGWVTTWKGKDWWRTNKERGKPEFEQKIAKSAKGERFWSIFFIFFAIFAIFC